jgi:hypothetical protein
VAANRRLQPFRYLHDCSDRFRLERRVGLAPTRTASSARRRAELLRGAASHPTDGGKKTDRILLAMAERLEREAAEAEGAKRLGLV